MKIREFRLQKGIFIYKMGLSFTKVDFHLQNGTLGLQRGLSPYYSPWTGYWPVKWSEKHTSSRIYSTYIRPKARKTEPWLSVEKAVTAFVTNSPVPDQRYECPIKKSPFQCWQLLQTESIPMQPWKYWQFLPLKAVFWKRHLIRAARTYRLPFPRKSIPHW